MILDFGAFDAWYEEDELNVAHPRDPFHRIDVLPSSRQVRLELDGQVLAASSRPVLLFETMLPTRYYLPRADVTAELVPSSTRTGAPTRARRRTSPRRSAGGSSPTSPGATGSAARRGPGP